MKSVVIYTILCVICGIFIGIGMANAAPPSPCYLSSGTSTACYKPINSASGGTGQIANFTAGGLIFGATTTTMGSTAAGSAGQIIISAGTGTPVWGVDHLGTATNNDAAAGYVGEFMENARTSAMTIGTTSPFAGSIDSGASASGQTTTGETGIALTAGDWDISALCNTNASGGDTITQIECWIGTATGGSTTGRDLSRNYVNMQIPWVANADNSMALPTFRVSLSGSVTYYLKSAIAFTHGAGSITVQGSIRARRVR